MKKVRVTNSARRTDLASAALLADTRWTRLRGLLGRPRLQRGEGLVLQPSTGVHMWGMRYPIDVVLIDRSGRVVALYPDLRPWRRTRVHRDAARAIELPEGTIDRTGTRAGDRVEMFSLAAGDIASPKSQETK